MKVLLQANFLVGDKNVNNLKDFKHLNNQELELLFKFIRKVKNKRPLCGTNKKSDYCFNEEQRKIINRYNVFHYHLISRNCEIPVQDCINREKCLDISIEKKNIVSSEVIHYMLSPNKDFLIILGYSPIHDKGSFPKFYLNPLLQRLKSNLNIEYQTFLNFLNYCTENGLNANTSSLSEYIKK